jgi:hypothetical protein
MMFGRYGTKLDLLLLGRLLVVLLSRNLILVRGYRLPSTLYLASFARASVCFRPPPESRKKASATLFIKIK